MLQSIAKYSNDAVGIEKALKVLQSLAQVAESTIPASPDDIVNWKATKIQVAVARRYFRVFKWIDCWTLAYRQYEAYASPAPRAKEKDRLSASQRPPSSSARDNVHFLLIVSKWSLLGMYLFMEMFCFPDAIGATSNAWAPWLQIESLKFWFYSLAVAVLLDLYEIFYVYAGPTPASAPTTPKSQPKTRQKKPSEKKGGGQEGAGAPSSSSDHDPHAAKRRALYKQLAIDGFDLLIPGAIVGWTPLDHVTVGVAGSISGMLGGSDVWARVTA